MSVIAASALVPAFLFLAPDSTWQPQDLFTVLLSLGFVSFAAAARIRANVTLDAGFVPALLALVYLGPLPGALVFAAPDLARPLPGALVFAAPDLGRWVTGHPFPRFAANVASCGWSVVSAALLLEALGSEPPVKVDDVDAYAAVALAGICLLLVNYALITLQTGMIRDGIRFPVLARQELLPTAPVDLTLLAASLVTISLYEQFGIAGLAPLVAIVLMPRLVTPFFLKRKSVSQLRPFEATSIYAQAIAEELGVGTATKRVLADAATHFGGSARLSRIEDFQAVMRAVLYCKEPWNGDGGTAGMASGDEMPLESRILAVAHAWSTLTTTATSQLSPDEALHHLKARSGSDLDPKVVAAAVMVVEHETVPVSR